VSSRSRKPRQAAITASLSYRLRSKYRAKRTVIDGITFASRGEALRYQDLRYMEKAGRIKDLQLQVAYPMSVNGYKLCTYVADFVYLEDGKKIVEDFKGVRTPIFRLKAKMMKALLGIELRITGSKK